MTMSENLIKAKLESLEITTDIGMTVMATCDKEIELCNKYDHKFSVNVAAVSIKRGEVYTTAKEELGNIRKVAEHYNVGKSSVSDYIRIYEHKEIVFANADTLVDMSKRKLLQLIAPPKKATETVQRDGQTDSKEKSVDCAEYCAACKERISNLEDELEELETETVYMFEEVMKNNKILCRPCALGSYFKPVQQKGTSHGKKQFYAV